MPYVPTEIASSIMSVFNLLRNGEEHIMKHIIIFSILLLLPTDILNIY
jgi:hypothetical protein